MIRAATWESAHASRTQRTLSGGGVVWQTQYLDPPFPEPGSEIFPHPQAHNAEQGPHAVSLPHFHDEDQFQVVIAGRGSVGRHPVQPWTIHYTNRQTGYGPIVASDQGLSYLTLRQIKTKGIWYLKDSRERPERDAPKRQRTSNPLPPTDFQALQRLVEPSIQAVIEPEEDGLGAWVVRVPPGQTLRPPVHPGGTGSYYIVTTGDMTVSGARHKALSIVFAFDEPNFQIATAGGLEVLVLQYPGGNRVLDRKAKSESAQGPRARLGPTTPGTAAL